jgi:hypothetical protein
MSIFLIGISMISYGICAPVVFKNSIDWVEKVQHNFNENILNCADFEIAKTKNNLTILYGFSISTIVLLFIISGLWLCFSSSKDLVEIAAGCFVIFVFIIIVANCVFYHYLTSDLVWFHKYDDVEHFRSFLKDIEPCYEPNEFPKVFNETISEEWDDFGHGYYSAVSFFWIFICSFALTMMALVFSVDELDSDSFNSI